MLKNIIEKIFNSDGSVSVNDEAYIKSFTDNPDFPFLISFSRTGSHWLRMVMELYFEKPALVRAFYYKNATNFTCLHSHDMDLRLQRRNVIYLYRNPVETIYSQLSYYEEDIHDKSRRMYWTNVFAKHLSKWLVREVFTDKKTILTYENMQSAMENVIEKICCHFDCAFDREKLVPVMSRVSKEELKRKTGHDKKVVNLSGEYQQMKTVFVSNYANEIVDYILSYEPELQKWLTESSFS